jgi:hypothetical protein
MIGIEVLETRATSVIPEQMPGMPMTIPDLAVRKMAIQTELPIIAEIMEGMIEPTIVRKTKLINRILVRDMERIALIEPGIIVSEIQTIMAVTKTGTQIEVLSATMTEKTGTLEIVTEVVIHSGTTTAIHDLAPIKTGTTIIIPITTGIETVVMIVNTDAPNIIIGVIGTVQEIPIITIITISAIIIIMEDTTKIIVTVITIAFMVGAYYSHV